MLALRWRDVDWAGSALTISRAVSAGVEGATKSGRIRRCRCPTRWSGRWIGSHSAMTSQAQATSFSATRSVDGLMGPRCVGATSARDAAGVRPLRWHDLRRTFGSLLVAGGIDLRRLATTRGTRHLDGSCRCRRPGRQACRAARRPVEAHRREAPGDGSATRRGSAGGHRADRAARGTPTRGGSGSTLAMSVRAWLKVVVSFDAGAGRIITAFPRRTPP